MNNDATSKYTPISKVKELNKLIGDQKGLTSSDETTGVSELNRPYLYKVKNEDDAIQYVNDFYYHNSEDDMVRLPKDFDGDTRLDIIEVIKK